MQDRINAPYLEDDVSTARFHDVLCTAGAMGKTLLISPRAVDGGAAYYRDDREQPFFVEKSHWERRPQYSGQYFSFAR